MVYIVGFLLFKINPSFLFSTSLTEQPLNESFRIFRKKTKSNFEFSWSSTKKNRYHKPSLMQEGKERRFYILETSPTTHMMLCESYCVQNVPHANIM